jgi:hypothetical protein
MTRAFKILTFQASALAAGVLMMSVAADMARAVPAPVSAAVATVMSRLSRGRAILAKALLPPAIGDDEQSRSVK